MAEEKFTDAIDMLENDHREVEDLFEDFEDTDDSEEKQKIAAKICLELKIHSMLEEEIFYPAFRGKIDDAIIDEAIVEHDGAKVLINDIEAGDADEDFYEAKLAVLSEQIEHHVEEEEEPEDGMFAQARETDVDLEDLRDQMLKRKKELLKQAKSEGLPPAQLSAVSAQEG